MQTRCLRERERARERESNFTKQPEIDGYQKRVILVRI